MSRKTARKELEGRLAWLLVLRVVVITAVLGSAASADVIARRGGLVHPLYLLVALTYLFTLIYALLWSVTASHRQVLAAVQILLDLGVVTAIVFFTGGIESNFAVLYFIVIIAASIILYREGGLAAATVASVFYAALAELLHLRALSAYPWLGAAVAPSTPAQVVYYTIFLNVFGFFMVAILTSYLSERLRKTGRELQETSDHLADLQAFNQTVIDSITAGLMTADLDGRISFFNRSAENILGLSAPQAVGRTVAELLGEREDFIERLKRLLEERRYCRLEGTYLNHRREEIYLGLSVSYLLFRGERRSGFLFAFQDLSEIRQLERQMRLRENLATMGEMAASMAHEIRNPLASISGSVQVLKEEVALIGEHSRLMDIIVRESERLSGTLNEFLAYARPPRFQPESLDLRSVVEETAALLRNSAEVLPEHEIVLNLPETPVLVFADANQMKQIAWNLSKNALQAMPRGGRLEVELARNGTGEVVLAFRDEGVGLRDGEVHQVFKPFTGSFERGAGLGLAIVYRIVKDYQGEIRVDSRRPRGTEISVRFPLERRSLS